MKSFDYYLLFDVSQKILFKTHDQLFVYTSGGQVKTLSGAFNVIIK